jgi:hypothetical protein
VIKVTIIGVVVFVFVAMTHSFVVLLQGCRMFYWTKVL